MTPPLSPSIITVGSTEDRAYFTKQTSFSRFTKTPNYTPDIWATGEDVVSVLSPQYDFHLPNRSRRNIKQKHYIAMSGASMATPLVSGYIALLLEQIPQATPHQIKQMLLDFCRPTNGVLS